MQEVIRLEKSVVQLDEVEPGIEPLAVGAVLKQLIHAEMAAHIAQKLEIADRPQLTRTERAPPPHGRLGFPDCAGKRPHAAELLREHRDCERCRKLDRDDAPWQLGADLLGTKVLIAVQGEPGLAGYRDDCPRKFARLRWPARSGSPRSRSACGEL